MPPAPELIDDPDEGGLADETESPLQLDAETMRRQIEALQARLAELASPEEKVTVHIPYDATGEIVRINGVKLHGQQTISRSTLTQVLSMLTGKEQVERERLMKRGNRAGVVELEAADAASRIVSRREGQRVL